MDMEMFNCQFQVDITYSVFPLKSELRVLYSELMECKVLYIEASSEMDFI